MSLLVTVVLGDVVKVLDVENDMVRCILVQDGWLILPRMETRPTKGHFLSM